MIFRAPDGSEFGVLLAGDLVVDMKSGNEKKALGVRPFVLPATIPDAPVGSDLRIGLSLKQADALMVRRSIRRSPRRLRDNRSFMRPASPGVNVAWSH